MTDFGTDPLAFAKYFATQEHVLKLGQCYGPLPYTHHLAAVEAELRTWGVAEGNELLVAAWLHDIVEDTPIKLKQIAEQFGDEVAVLVGAVTNEPGANRKERHLATYPKLRAAGGRAVLLKLADRCANVRAGGSLVSMYRKEHQAFKEALYVEGEYGFAWKTLEGLLADA